jgi:PIN domain nuclease of toxin-antitoxin system
MTLGMQRFLLDTNIVVRWLYEPERIPADIQDRLRRSVTAPMFSAVTPYELTLKSNIGKLGLDVADLLERLASYGFMELPVRAVHAVEAGRLPLFHRDPFDRLLVAQARIEDCILVTTDAQLAAFDVTVHHVPR